MSEFDSNRRNREEQRKQKRQTREIMAKFFLDLSKISVTAMVVTAFSPWFTDYNADVNLVAAAIGLLSAIIFSVVGYRIIKSK